MIKNKEVYWVTSDGEEPTQIYFTLGDAVLTNSAYIDSFGADGKVIKRMKRIGDMHYTTEF